MVASFSIGMSQFRCDERVIHTRSNFPALTALSTRGGKLPASESGWDLRRCPCTAQLHAAGIGRSHAGLLPSHRREP